MNFPRFSIRLVYRPDSAGVLVLKTMWAPKGGVGLSVAAAALAMAAARRYGEAILVDLCDDQAAVLGCNVTDGLGISDWMDSDDATSESLPRLMIEVGFGVRLLPRGTTRIWDLARTDQLIAVLSASDSPVIVDGGVLVAGSGDGDHQVSRRQCLARSLADAGSSILVTASCYLALRKCVEINEPPDGIVVVTEPGRALEPKDVAALLGRPLLTSIVKDPAVARGVDAGLLTRRPVRSLLKAMDPVLDLAPESNP